MNSTLQTKKQEDEGVRVMSGSEFIRNFLAEERTENVTIRGIFEPHDLAIKGKGEIVNVTFDCRVNFRHCTFPFSFRFIECKFLQGLDFHECTFKDILVITGTIKSVLSITESVFENYIDISDLTIPEGSLYLRFKKPPAYIYVSSELAELVHWAAPTTPIVVKRIQ